MSNENSPLLRHRHGDIIDNVEDDQDAEELVGCDATPACNPHHRMHRYLVLIPICFLSFGKCYPFDIYFSY